MKYLLWLTLPLYILDQITKWLVIRNIELYDGFPVIPGFFNLVHVTNTGAAFGAFQDGNTFFIGLSTVALGVLGTLWYRGSFETTLSQIGAALFISGILGNLTDRIIHKHVIDFVDVFVGSHHWPAFNVADSAICVAAGLFVLDSFRQSPKKSDA